MLECEVPCYRKLSGRRPLGGQVILYDEKKSVKELVYVDELHVGLRGMSCVEPKLAIYISFMIRCPHIHIICSN